MKISKLKIDELDASTMQMGLMSADFSASIKINDQGDAAKALEKLWFWAESILITNERDFEKLEIFKGPNDRVFARLKYGKLMSKDLL